MFVLLFWPNMDSIYNPQFLSIIWCHKFDIVIYLDRAERKEYVSCMLMQCIWPKIRMFDGNNEL